MQNRARGFNTLVLGLSVSLVGVGIAGLLGCTTSTTTPTPTPTSTAPISDLPLVSLDTAHVPLPNRLVLFCNRQGWTEICRVPEFTDDQRWNSGNGQYGPYAYTIPADSLAERANASSFASIGDPVAAIFVDTVGTAQVLPAPYRQLDLSPGINCVYLKYNPNATYTGYIVPEAPTGTPCPSVTSLPGPGLRVIAILAQGFGTSDDVPAVARFHEGTGGPILPGAKTLLGVKCAEKWCMLTPPGASPDRPPHQGMHPTQREWAVYGWGDAQHLGIFDGTSNHIVRGSVDASIIPGPATTFVGEDKFENGFVHGATVHFNASPGAGKYQSQWGFKKGDNEIWIRKVISATGSVTWTGKVRSYGWLCSIRPCWHTVHVIRTDHQGVYPPATARFRWDEADEGIWMRCDDGCCKVSGT